MSSRNKIKIEINDEEALFYIASLNKAAERMDDIRHGAAALLALSVDLKKALSDQVPQERMDEIMRKYNN